MAIRKEAGFAGIRAGEATTGRFSYRPPASVFAELRRLGSGAARRLSVAFVAAIVVVATFSSEAAGRGGDLDHENRLPRFAVAPLVV